MDAATILNASMANAVPSLDLPFVVTELMGEGDVEGQVEKAWQTGSASLGGTSKVNGPMASDASPHSREPLCLHFGEELPCQGTPTGRVAVGATGVGMAVGATGVGVTVGATGVGVEAVGTSVGVGEGVTGSVDIPPVSGPAFGPRPRPPSLALADSVEYDAATWISA